MTDNETLKKLVLGTAQFDPTYGFDAAKGQLACENYSLKLISQAWDAGINKIDTAPAYGAAHQVVKKYLLANRGHCFSVTTKLKADVYSEINEVRDLLSINNSLDMTILLHREASIDEPETVSSISRLSDEFERVNWGVSLYNLKAAEKALKIPGCAVIQIPFSVFNQDFLHSNFIEKAQGHGVKVVARSIFSLGAIFRPISFFDNYPKPVKETLIVLHEFAAKFNVNLSTLACQFVARTGKVDEIVVGVNTTGQLADIAQIEFRKEMDDLFSFVVQQSKSWESSLFRPELWK
tara:strand:+ start:1677 stop:2555 length:879 start_codon:yes stop_codon:yes gene_type:complete